MTHSFPTRRSSHLTPPMAGTAHGERGRVRNLGGRCGAGARHRALTCRIRPAACLCSRGNDCTTKTGRSCRCADAWVRRTAGMPALRSEEHTSELQSLMRNSYAVFCLKKKTQTTHNTYTTTILTI